LREASTLRLSTARLDVRRCSLTRLCGTAQSRIGSMQIRWSAAAVGREVAHSVFGWQAEFFKLVVAFFLYFKRLF